MNGLTDADLMFRISSMRSVHRTSLVPPSIAVASAVLVVGVAYGAAASNAGFPAWLVILAAVLVLSASSELVFVSVIGAGGLPWVAVGAALLVNLRNVVYGISAATFLPPSHLSRLLSAHLVNDETVAFALAQSNPARRGAAFRVAGIAILVAWPFGAAVGVLVGTVVPDPALLGLDAAFPAIFLAILVGAISRRTAGPALGGAVLAAAATPFVASGVAPIIGLLGLLVGARKQRDRA